MTESHPSNAIAVVGMSGRFPGARDIAEFWKNLRDGVESISNIKPEELDESGFEVSSREQPGFVSAGGFLDDADLFDAKFFGFSPREAETLDPQHRLFLECCWQALEDAGCNPETYPGAIGVYAGSLISLYLFNVLSHPGIVQKLGPFQVFTSNDKDHLATRVSYKLNLRGPSMGVQTACSTALVAVCMACQSLLDQQCDMALAGGVAIRVPQKTGYVYQEGMIYSRDGHCRPFDADATGTLFTNGLGVVALKRLEDAQTDGDTIHAVIRGWALNNDGSNKVGYTAPGLDSQAEVIATAQALAGVNPETITYIEAHGTGTSLGDPIEIAALTQAFRLGTQRNGFCAIGSAKSNIGHMDSAAGIAGLIKTVLALEHGLIPPSLHFQKPNPAIDFENSPFFVNTKLSEWKPDGMPRRAGVSSFGIGGTNAHVVLEEAPKGGKNLSLRPEQLLILSARSDEALNAATANLATYLEKNPATNLADVAFTLQSGRKAFAHRRYLVASHADATTALKAIDPARVVTSSEPPRERPCVFLFPGQGTQYAGMGQGLYKTEPTFRLHVDECCELLRAASGFDLRELLFPTPQHQEEAQQRLMETAVTQPALFVVEYALAQLWMEWGIRPHSMAGHSVGEYVAACLAGVFSLRDALGLVAARGRLMQALPRGSMLAVPLPEAEVRSLIGLDLDIATINEIRATVVAGNYDAIEKLAATLKSRGVECRKLHTSHAFHSRMMDPILKEFEQAVGRLPKQAPQIPFASNTTGKWITESEAASPAYWSAHIRGAVRFADNIAELAKIEGAIFLEVGPGQVLGGLVRRHPDYSAHQSVLRSLPAPQEKKGDLNVSLQALGQIWLLGGDVDWKGFHVHEKLRRIPLPTYPFERQRYWMEKLKPTVVSSGADRAADNGRKSEMQDSFSVPMWKQSVSAKESSSAGEGPWLVFADDAGLAEQFTKHLAKIGQSVVTVTASDRFAKLGENQYQIRPAYIDDYSQVVRAARGGGKTLKRVAHFWGTTKSDSGDLERLKERGLWSVLALAQALGEHGANSPTEFRVITNNVFSVTGDEQIVPGKALALGPCRVISLEYAHLNCGLVDITLPSTDEQRASLAARLLAEFEPGSKDPVAAYRGARRWVQGFEALRLDEASAGRAPFREGGVYFITGGMGGVGLALAKYLAQTKHAKLALLGRSPLPDRPMWAQWVAAYGNDASARKIRAVQAIEAAGGKVMVLAADVTNAGQVQDAVRKVKDEFGEINGVIHAAGLPGGNMISVHHTADAAQVLAPKVEGMLALDEAFRGEKLDFLALCSSVSSLVGGFGQADYAAANAFLDAYAQSRASETHPRVTSINWELWRDAGMGVNVPAPRGMEEERRKALEEGIASEEGADAFARALSAGLPQIIVSRIGVEARRRQFEASAATMASAAAAMAEKRAHASPAPESTTKQTPTEGESAPVVMDPVQKKISEIWCELLGVKQVRPFDNFFDLGGHSLLGTQLIAQIRTEFQLELPLRSLLEVPTVAGMAERVRSARGGYEDEDAE
jgi:acyl transferase domain-containing protein/acyl carrier protein